MGPAFLFESNNPSSSNREAVKNGWRWNVLVSRWRYYRQEYSFWLFQQRLRVIELSLFKMHSKVNRQVSAVPSVLAFNQTSPDANRFGESIRILLR